MIKEQSPYVCSNIQKRQEGTNKIVPDKHNNLVHGDANIPLWASGQGVVINAFIFTSFILNSLAL